MKASWTQVALEARVLKYKTDDYELFANWLERLGYPMTLEQVKAEVNRIRQDGKDKPEGGASYFLWLWLKRAKAPQQASRA